MTKGPWNAISIIGVIGGFLCCGPISAVACDDRFPFTCITAEAPEEPTRRAKGTKPLAVASAPNVSRPFVKPMPRPRPYSASHVENGETEASDILPTVGQSNVHDSAEHTVFNEVQYTFDELAKVSAQWLEKALRKRAHQMFVDQSFHLFK